MSTVVYFSPVFAYPLRPRVPTLQVMVITLQRNHLPALTHRQRIQLNRAAEWLMLGADGACDWRDGVRHLRSIHAIWSQVHGEPQPSEVPTDNREQLRAIIEAHVGTPIIDLAMANGRWWAQIASAIWSRTESGGRDIKDVGWHRVSDLMHGIDQRDRSVGQC